MRLLISFLSILDGMSMTQKHRPMTLNSMQHLANLTYAFHIHSCWGKHPALGAQHTFIQEQRAAASEAVKHIIHNQSCM